VALINELFSSGDFVGTADIVPLKPPLPGLGGTVQTAIAASVEGQRILSLELSTQQAQIGGLLAQPALHLATLPDVNMGQAQNGGILVYSDTAQAFALEDNPPNLVVDGGNF
jgi:hypothetical protein